MAHRPVAALDPPPGRRDPQAEVGVLAVGAREPLVEPAGGLQGRTAVGQVGRRPARLLQAARAALPVGGAAAGGNRDDDPALHAADVRGCGRELRVEASQPAGLRLDVVVEERDPFGAARAPAGVARGGRSARRAAHDAHAGRDRERLVRIGAIVDHDDPPLGAAQRGQQRFEARAPRGGDHDLEAQAITSARCTT